VTEFSPKIKKRSSVCGGLKSAGKLTKTIAVRVPQLAYQNNRREKVATLAMPHLTTLTKVAIMVQYGAVFIY
jgi:hypothetical protein